MSAQGGATGSVHVNVFGGPGSGKSTMAYAVAAELKARGYTAECVGEVVKDCIYDAARGDQEAARLLDGSVESQEELYRRQSARERRLDGLVQFVVADSPAIMGLAYLAPDADEDRAARQSRAHRSVQNSFFMEHISFHNKCISIFHDRR